MEKLWTGAEVARYLGVGESEVEKLIRQGKLTGYKLGGQFLRFRPDQVKLLKPTLLDRGNDNSKSSIFDTVTLASSQKDPWYHQLRDFFYFYDFYIVSSVLLTLLAVYLIASG